MKYTYILYLIEIMQNQQHDSVEIEPLSNIHYSSCDDSESDDSDSTVSESDSIRSVEMSDLEIKPLSNIHYSSCDDSESDDSESNSIRTVEMLSDLDEENIIEMDVDPFPLKKNMKRKFEMTTAMRDNKENDQTLKNYDKINK